MKPQDLREYMTTNSRLFFFLMIGLVVFAGIALYVNLSFGAMAKWDDELTKLFLTIYVVIAAASVFAGFSISKLKLRSIVAESSIEEKLSAYRAALILRWAMIEGPCLFGLVIFVLSGANMAMAISLVLMCLLALNRPTKWRLIGDLQLSPEEQKLLDANTIETAN